MYIFISYRYIKVIQRRVDGTVDFYRPWYDYKAGFGTPTGNVWLGKKRTLLN
jgi:hypothetical protein